MTAAAVFWLAFNAGTYGLQARNSLAIVVWWALAVGVATGVLPLRRPSYPMLIPGAFLAGLALLSGVSAAWSASTEKAVDELNRGLLYLGVYCLAVSLSERENARRIADGIAIGVVAITAVAFASRCFPALPGDSDLPQFLPAARNRLSFPVGYWNALAILAALASPLVLRAAVASTRLVARAAAVASVPLLAAVVYLTSSRGGVAVGVVGLGVFVLLAKRSGAALGALALAAVGSAGTIGVLVARPGFVDEPPASGVTTTGGWTAALLVAALCLATGASYALACLWMPRVPTLGRPIRGALAGAGVLAALLALAVADPVERFETFKRPPTQVAQPQSDFVREHLLSAGGSGRWQFWGVAVEAFETKPLLGHGAGSYEAWWARHASFSYFVKDAHSLYLEVLGELGLLGFAFLAGFVFGGVQLVARAIRRSAPDDRATAAALAGVFAGYLVGVGIDWMWELTVVSVVGVACVGLLAAIPDARPAATPSRGPRLALSAVASVVSVAVIACEAFPLLANRELAGSQSAHRRGAIAEGRDRAELARALTPWAASPYLQLGLLAEAEGNLRVARADVASAIQRDPDDWRLWLVSARLATKAGAIGDARRSLAKAASLNPRSPLFAKGP